MAIKNLGLSWISVSDIKKAKEFFIKKLGLELCKEDSICGWLELQITKNGPRIGVAHVKDSSDDCCPLDPGQNAIMTFQVDDLEDAKKIYSEKGVKFLGNVQTIPGEVKLVLFQDDDKNLFQLVEKLT